MNRTLLSIGAAVVAGGLVTNAQAITTVTGFGSIPGVAAGSNPYSGTGIPFDTSEYEVISQIPGVAGTPMDTLTISQAATQHGSLNPAPGNDGAGTYTVETGLNGGRSKWNFDFYLNSAQNELNDYTFSLTEQANGHTFSFDPAAIADNTGGPASAGNSESLDFPFGIPLAYDANANDTYHFTLDAFLGGTQIGQDKITVVAGTGAVPDNASTAGLMVAGLAGLAFIGNKRNMRSLVSKA